MRDHRRRGTNRVLVCCVTVTLLGSAPTLASSAPRQAPPPEEARLPAEVEQILMQQQQAGRSNLMFAQLARPRHKGYDWSVVAFKQGPSARTNLTISFHRTGVEGTQTQTSKFGWALPRGALRMDRDLKPSSLDSARAMGNNGRISMQLSGDSQFVRLRDPENCTGSISYRVGTFRGAFRFDARDQYFGKISFRRAQVALYRAEDLECPGPAPAPPCPDDLSLSAVDAETGVAIGAFRTDEGKVDQSVVVVGSSGKARTSHRIDVTVAVPDAFQASDDLTTASLDGDVAGPWLSGDLSYIAPPPPAPGEDPDCGAYQSSSGVVTGDYTADFDSIGPITPASTSLSATLRREAS